MGLVVDAVEAGSPAEAAGVKPHDILLKLDDQKLINMPQLEVLVRAQRPGDSVTLTLIHEGKPTTVTAKLIEKEVPILDFSSPAGVLPNRILITPPTTSATRGDVPRLVTPDGRTIITGGGAVYFSPHAPATTAPAAPAAPPHLDQHATSSSMSSSTGADGHSVSTHTLQNSAGTFTLTMTDGDQHFLAKDPSGKVLFDGPVNTDAERQKVPAEILPQLQAMEGKAVK